MFLVFKLKKTNNLTFIFIDSDKKQIYYLDSDIQVYSEF